MTTHANNASDGDFDEARLAEKIARAIQHDAADGTVTVHGWEELTHSDREQRIREAVTYMKAASRSGIAIADLDDCDLPTAVQPSRLRPTATVRGTNGHPLERDDYASHLQAQVDLGRGGHRRPLLIDEEAQSVAALLDELAGVYPGENLGRLARDLAVRISDRLGR